MSMTQFVESLADQGRGGDTILAHITPEEAQLLKEHGGSGTVNPETGLMEFGFFSDLWDGFKSLVRTIAPVLIPAIAIFAPWVIPAIGTALGASAVTASLVGSVALSAGVTLASGGSLKDVLTSAAMAGASAYLSPILGKALTPVGSSQLTQVLAGSAAFGAGYTALRGGSVKEMLAAGATGAASAYLQNIASSAVAKMNNLMGSGRAGNIAQKGATDAVFAGADAANLKNAGLSQQQIADTLRASGVDSISADYAAAKATIGMGADDIAANLAANRPSGIYKGEANTHSITAGQNADLVQRVEDANFVAEDAARLKAQGLTKAQIVENLLASGVEKNMANTVASYADQGKDARTIGDMVVKSTGYLTKGQIFTNTPDTINREIGKAMTAEQQASYKAIPYKDLVNSGVISIDEANVLNQQGVTQQQVQDLTKLGYTGSGISDMIGAGVKVTDLTNLAKTPFAESTINDLLMSGSTVNDLSQASSLVNNKTISLDTATQLLEKGVSGTTITRVASTRVGAADAFNTLIDKGVSSNNAYDLATKGYDLTKVNSLIDSGKVNATTLNDTVGRGNYGSWLNSQMTTTQTTQPTQPVAPVQVSSEQQIINTGLVSGTDAAVLAESGYTANDVKSLINAGYTAPDLVELASTGVTATTLNQLATTKFPEASINDMLMNGVSANDIGKASGMVNLGGSTIETAQRLLNEGVTGTQLNVLNQGASVQKLLDAGMSFDKINQLYNGVGLDNVAKNLGKLDITAINNSNDPTSVYKTQITVSPIKPVDPTQPTAPTVVSSEQQIINTGLVSGTDAAVLADSGYSATDVKNLINAGYTAPDLVELASTGVPASTLTSLAQTRFAEATINDMLMSGKSANDIAYASNMVNVGATSQANAEKILNSGATGTTASSQLSMMLNNGNASAKLLDAGVNPSQVAALISKGNTAINTAVNNIGKFDPTIVNNSTDPTTSINNQIKYGYGNETMPAPKPVEPTPVQPPVVEPTPVEPTPVQPTPVEPTPVQPPATTPTTIAVTLPDGSVGQYDPSTGTTYNSDGSVNAGSSTVTPGAGVDVTGPATGMKDPSAPGVAVGGSNLSLNSDSYGYRIPSGTVYQNGLTYQGDGRWTMPNGRTMIIGANGWDDPSVSAFNPNNSYVTKFGAFGAEGTEPTPGQGTNEPIAGTPPGSEVPPGTSLPTPVIPGTETGTETGTGTGTSPVAPTPVTPSEPTAPTPVEPTPVSPQPPAPTTPTIKDWIVDTVLGTQYPVDKNYERIGPDITYNGTVGVGEPIVNPPVTIPTPITPPVPPRDIITQPVDTPPVVQPPVTPPVVQPPVTPPVVTPPVVQPPVVEPPVQPPVVQPPVVTPPITPVEPPVVQPPVTPPVVTPPTVPVVPGDGTGTTPVVTPPTVPVVPGTGPGEEEPIVPITPVIPGTGTPGTGTPGTPITTPGPITVPGDGTGTPGTPVVTPPVVQPPVVQPPVVQPPVVQPPVVEPPVVPPVVEPPPVEPPPVEPPPVEPPPVEPPVVEPPEPDPFYPIPPPIIPKDPPGAPFFRAPVLPSISPQPLAKGGLNPGYITDVPDFYNTTNNAQSKYYWGRHAYQPGPMFNEQLYNTSPQAPVQPFGIQNMATNMLSYDQLLALGSGQQLQPIAPSQVATPANPQYQQYNGPGPYTQPIVPQMVATVPYRPMLSYEEYARSLTDPNYVPS